MTILYNILISVTLVYFLPMLCFYVLLYFNRNEFCDKDYELLKLIFFVPIVNLIGIMFLLIISSKNWVSYLIRIIYKIFTVIDNKREYSNKD